MLQNACLTFGEHVQFEWFNGVPRDMFQFTPTLRIKEHLLFEVPVVVVNTPQLNWGERGWRRGGGGEGGEGEEREGREERGRGEVRRGRGRGEEHKGTL